MRESLPSFFPDFSISAVIDGRIVAGIYDNAYASALGFTAGSAPMLVCRAADVADVDIESAVQIDDSAFTVAGIEPDGTGMTVLRLARA